MREISSKSMELNSSSLLYRILQRLSKLFRSRWPFDDLEDQHQVPSSKLIRFPLPPNA
ncbi:hypothetical protein BT96DRAFT_1024688 [Gymnopus androsaceus JB14]|uniref:Uncharacterized protein n=1 Tax=Gymnopus androsaceus JB14 TaxID=1447944 RepID=A0A6A4GXJ1_9AGAR|nr:hypothetical protein BT96DRAFT_1024688 [Gymnopus androsaceus JB14]